MVPSEVPQRSPDPCPRWVIAVRADGRARVDAGRIRREPPNRLPKMLEAVVVSDSATRIIENRALWNHARTRMAPETVVVFRCECEHALCREVVVITLDEYAAATLDGNRAVIHLAHADVDSRPVVSRADRYCTVEEARPTL